MWTFRRTLLLGLVVLLLKDTQSTSNPDDDVFHIDEPDTFDWSKHPCKRDCKDDEAPKKCYYSFVVEIYSTMSKACYNCSKNLTDCSRPHCVPADGKQKIIYTVNRQLPGTTIEVCMNDEIIVDVKNGMMAESTAIHWHGIKQEGTPYMDGVPFVTQCPILPGNSFKYTFNASHSGTYFWHSHIGVQRDDGLFGPLIIHSAPKDNVHKKLYDYDNHVMVINDWTHQEANSHIVKIYQAGGEGFSDSILINGLGRHLNTTGKIEKHRNSPTAVFKVEKSFRYRFRLIVTGTTACPMLVTIDNHTMTVISLDGNDVEPVEVDAIQIFNGERIDFVVNANQEIGNYWIRYRGSGMCSGGNNKVYQVSILRYESAVIEDPSSPVDYDLPKLPKNARIMNLLNEGTENKKIVSVPSFNSTSVDDDLMTDRPVDHRLYISYDLYSIDNHEYHRKDLYGFNQSLSNFKRRTLQFNRIGFKLPSFPLVSQPDGITEDTFCNATSLRNQKKDCVKDECACTHVLQVKLNSVVELVIIDEGVAVTLNGFIHPMHLHGHFFRVVAMEHLTEPISVDLMKKMDSLGKIKRKLSKAPIKDTVKVPKNGYTIVRFHATNPGYWFYHCHIDQHTNNGMALVFKVGEHEDFPPVPNRFPTCGNF